MPRPLGVRAPRLALFSLVAACNTGPAPVGSGAPAPSASPAPVASSAPAQKGAPSATDFAASHGVTLVSVEGPLPPADTSLPLVTVSKTELLVGATHLADVPPDRLGFEASIKRAGQRSALQVLPLAEALKSAHALAPSESTVRFLFDASASYRSALEVIFTASHAGFTSFDFVVSSQAGERTLPASTPSQAEWEALHTPGATPPPTFLLTKEGVSVAVGNDTVGPGCVKGPQGMTVPSLNPSEVASCASRLGGMSPAWAQLHIANVSASGGLDLQTVLAVVAALEKTFRPFFLIPDQARRAQCERTWRDLLGDHVIAMEKPEDTCFVSAGIVALSEHVVADLDQVASVILGAGADKAQVGRVVRALTPYAATLGVDGVPGPRTRAGAVPTHASASSTPSLWQRIKKAVS